LNGTTQSISYASSSKGSGDYYKTFLKEYPHTYFVLKGIAYRAAAFNKEIVSKIEHGHPLFIGIDKNEYYGKTGKTINPFADDYTRWHILYMHDLSYTYLSLKDYNLENNSDGIWSMWLFGILAAAIFGFNVYVLMDEFFPIRKNTNSFLALKRNKTLLNTVDQKQTAKYSSVRVHA
jgi:hypothetical protein